MSEESDKQKSVFGFSALDTAKLCKRSLSTYKAVTVYPKMRSMFQYHHNQVFGE